MAHDRFKESGLDVVIGVDEDGLWVDVGSDSSRQAGSRFPDMDSLKAELDNLPSIGTAMCPCGCGADLSIRECLRNRVRQVKGAVCLIPPAIAIRDKTHPSHEGHAMEGWCHGIEPDPELGKKMTYIACGCGEVLGVDFAYAVQEGLPHNFQMGSGGDVGWKLERAVQRAWENVRHERLSQQEQAVRYFAEQRARELGIHSVHDMKRAEEVIRHLMERDPEVRRRIDEQARKMGLRPDQTASMGVKAALKLDGKKPPK